MVLSLVDAEAHHFLEAVKESTKHSNQRGKFVHYLQHRFTTADNSNNVLPCLSVRTGFDLFLTVKGYPPGSEVIMSAINIPDMVQIVQHHGLKVRNKLLILMHIKHSILIKKVIYTCTYQY